MSPPRKISQTQIARDLGISQALVSLALNGRKSGINAKTYQRIWDRAIELGYTPKGMEIDTAMAARRTRIAGYILRSPLRLYTQSNFFSHVQHGLYATLQAEGCTATFLGAEDELEGDNLDRSVHRGDALLGIILLGEVKLPFLDRLREKKHRIVSVSASFPGYCSSVTSNEQQAVDMLVSHLTGIGHRRLCWIGGNVGMSRHTERKKALQNALRSKNLTIPDELWLDDDDPDKIGGSRAIRRILERTTNENRPTAVVCYNGVMARGAVNAIHAEGLRIPDDLSVVAIDNTRVIADEHPTITGASASGEKMGEAAARLLLQQDQGTDEQGFTDLVIPATLKPGESSDAPRVEAS